MKRLLFFLRYLRRLDQLEQRVARLEADLQALASFKDNAHALLKDDKRPMLQRHESALQTLVCGGYKVPGAKPAVRVIGHFNTPSA